MVPVRVPTRRGLSVLFSFLLVSLSAFAQSPTAELRLSVKDSSGSALAAKGSLESLATGLRVPFEFDNQGTYVFKDLNPGRYRVEVAKESFATQALFVDLAPGATISQNVSLQLGSIAFHVDVAANTPLEGTDLALAQIPSPVQTGSARDIDHSGSLDIADFLNRRFNGVHVNEVTSNPLQPDINYRGFTASPLLGTPQGLSVYMDGMRLNQPFGDVVSWDLIPRIAISETTLMPGSNPLFGLNTLGGAISLTTKDGRTHPGTTIDLGGGSYGRRYADLEHGGANAKGLHWYMAGNLLFEDGWRTDSPTNVRQFFGRLGWQQARTLWGLSLGYANNTLIGNGLQEQRFLERDYKSIYTKPDETRNQAPMANLTFRHGFRPSLQLSGNAYYRYIRTKTLNGDINEDSLDQALYQPNAAERAALAAAGYSGYPTSGENASNTPYPYWRCIAQSLLKDEPAEKCNGLINRSHTQQHNYGVAGQLTWFGNPGGNRNQFTAGGAYDGNNVSFQQSAQLGYLNPDRSVTGVDAYGDGINGGDEDGVPYDTRVNLGGRIQTGSFYLTDTLSIGQHWNVTVSGRFNRTTVNNRDKITPGGGSGSLDSDNSFSRFNPAAGVTYSPSSYASFYAGYSEGNRAPTSIELGCADPNYPCKLPNAMASDPPLNQVVTRTLEAGIRGSLERSLSWSAGWFRAANRDDILFVASEQTGFGYFKNFGNTRRQGLQIDLSSRLRRVTIGGGYTFLDATFQSEEEVDGSSNSSNEEAAEGEKGMEGSIEIVPGNRIPFLPRHMGKAYLEVQATSKFLIDVGMIAMSSSYARGNENNQHEPDGTYYLGPGKAPAYAVVNLGARYQFTNWLQFSVQVNNLFDRRYYSAAQLGPTGFTNSGSFIARPFPAVDGEYPIQHATFYAPGAPRGIWGSVRFRF